MNYIKTTHPGYSWDDTAEYCLAMLWKNVLVAVALAAEHARGFKAGEDHAEEHETYARMELAFSCQ